MKNLGQICDRVVEYSFYLLFFLVPLAVTPFNFELFEFNKMLVVYFFTAMITAAWLVKMVLAKKVIFRRSFWDLPLTIFLITQLLSYFFSIDRHTSFWGYYSRFNGGLLSVISYLLLYWAYVSNMDKRNSLFAIRYSLFAAALVAAYGIAEHFGIDAQYWVQDVRNRVFSTLGQPNWLAAWLTALMPLTWALALNSIRQLGGRNSKFYIYYLLFTIYYLCLLFTKSRSGILGFGVAFGIFWPLVFWVYRQNWRTILRPFLVFTFSILILSLIIGTPFTPSAQELIARTRPTTEEPLNNNRITIESTTNPPTGEAGQPLLISESSDIRKVVWKGALDIWRHHPIFGTGPETFAYSYYWYRPREHNDLSEWDFLYNKAHNEYLNYAATTGTIGLAAYLILIGSFIFWSIKKVISCQLSVVSSALAAGFSSIAITNFFGFSVVPVSLLFFLFPAFTVATAGKPADKIQNSQKISPGQWLVIAGILLLTFNFSLLTLKYWFADVQFSKAEKLGKSGQYNLAFKAASQAVGWRTFEPGYHDELALSAAGLAILAKNENNATLSARLAKMAVDQSSLALKISPFNLNFWKNRVKIFYRLGELDSQYYQQALTALLQAEQLAPTDPKIKYNLGLLYAQFGQTETAIKTLEETIKLKPNYEDVRYTLSLFYEQAGQKDKARQQLQEILKINPQNQKVKEKLESLR